MRKKSIDLPLPTKEDTINIQVQVPRELGDAFKDEIANRKISIKDATIWGIKMFLLKSNPELAISLGITDQD